MYVHLWVCAVMKKKGGGAGCFSVFWWNRRGQSICESWECKEEETDGLHYVSQQETVVRYCVIQASRKTPAECFCRAVPDFHHRYTDWILFSCMHVASNRKFVTYGILLLVVVFICLYIMVVAHANKCEWTFYPSQCQKRTFWKIIMYHSSRKDVCSSSRLLSRPV